MKKILFPTCYPTDQTLKDGMVQRVKNIDDLFIDHPRIYLDIEFWRHAKKQIYEPQRNVKEYKLNAILHFFCIWRLMKKSEIIYLHSIYGVIKIIFQLYFFRKHICLDMHGVVPEENLIENGKLHFYYFKVIERVAIYLATKVIYVSNSMKRYFINQYPSITKKDIIYPIFANIRYDHIPADVMTYMNGEETVFIYSGNLQSWQNIEEVLNIILRYQHIQNYRFIILTGKPDLFKRQILKHQISLDRIEISCVNSDEIDQYYKQAHYGFILRSEYIINQVANPTKMMEYLLFGIIPIVRSVNIGDFNTYNYEFLREADFHGELKPKKSQINKDIAFKILNEKEDLWSFVTHD